MPLLHSPCRGCNERYIGCHSECKYYKQYKEEQTVRYELKHNHIKEVKGRIAGRGFRI